MCLNGCLEQCRALVVMRSRVLREKGQSLDKVKTQSMRCAELTFSIHGKSCRIVCYHRHAVFAAEEKRLTGL